MRKAIKLQKKSGARPKRTHQFKVILSREELEMLMAMAAAEHEPASQWIRRLIRLEWETFDPPALRPNKRAV